MAKEGKEKVRVRKEDFKDEIEMAHMALGIAVVVALACALLLLNIYLWVPGTAQLPIFFSPESEAAGNYNLSNFTFRSGVVNENIIVWISVENGFAPDFFLYGNLSSHSLEGVGTNSSLPWATSNSNSLTVAKPYFYSRFVVSWNSSNDSRSYYLVLADINGSDSTKNTTSFASANNDRFFIDVGKSYILDGKINITLLSSNANYGNATIMVSSATADGGAYFDRIFDKYGNYIYIPQKNKFPAADYNLTVFNSEDLPLQKFRFYYDAGLSRFEAGGICLDFDGANFTLQSFSSKGAAASSDSCLSGQILKETTCDISGNIAYAEYNCSLGNLSCVEGRCSAVCTSNWTAVNTSCGGDELRTTYYTDIYACNPPSTSAPVNVTFRCDNDSNGLIGDNHAVGVARIDLLINIDKVEVNYSANYS
jgi:hypothetical protein